MNKTVEITPEIRRNYAAFEALAAQYSQDPEVRARIDSGDVSSSLVDLGVSIPKGVDAKIVANTTETFHVIFPPDPNTELGEEMLGVLSGGGKTAGSAASVGSAGSFACSSGPSTASSAGTAGTAGTAS